MDLEGLIEFFWKTERAWQHGSLITSVSSMEINLFKLTCSKGAVWGIIYSSKKVSI
jgi:hypothetical protein